MDTQTVRYRATLAYDGSAYAGFQRQADEPSIQAAVEAAVASVTGMQSTVIGAGRTDTGVHAIGQVIAFDVVWKHSVADLLRALNAVLPDDIALQDLTTAPAGFHPRFSAVARIYRYTLIQSDQRQPLMRQRAWHLRAALDGDALAAAAMLLLGEHDFATFGKPPQGENTVRLVMESHWTRRKTVFGTEWVYTIEANAFLQHMVRRIVGTLVEVGQSRLSLDAFAAAFASADLARSGMPAPPHGLVLEAVRYPHDP